MEGTWFPDAFIGPMSELMCKAENPDFAYINSIEDAIYTMACVEAAYKVGPVTLTGGYDFISGNDATNATAP